MTWLARAVFVLLIGATFAAFFVAQRLKGEAPVVEVRGLARYFSPNEDGRRDDNRFDLRLREATEVSVDVVDEAGDPVRRLTEAAAVEPGRPLPLSWDGRTEAGGRAPDGAYRLRVTISGEGRSVTPPRTTNVDTRPPRPRVRSITPGPIVGPVPGALEVRVGGVAARFAKRLRVFRTSTQTTSSSGTGEAPPREVAQVRVPPGSRSGEWDGLVDGVPAPPGTYLVEVRGRDRAGNRGRTPAEVPPQPGESVGAPGITVRAIAAEAPLRPVTAGERLTVNVDSRQRRYRWRLRRVGRSIPVATGRERAREPVELTAPDADSGLYLLELRSGEDTTAVPVLVQSRERSRMLVVVPAVTWVGTDEVDQDADGVPNTLEAGAPVNWPRVLAGGLPEDLTERVAPLLVHLDRAGLRYDLTSDLDLALSRGPRASDRPGVLLAGSQRWVPRPYARRLRRYVLDGGRLASFGTESLRRGVTVLRNRDETGGRLVRPTQPSPQDPFGTRLQDVRRTPEPATLTPIGGDAGYGLLEGSDGALTGFSVFEESEPPRERDRLLAALGVETAPEEEETGVPEALPPPALPALAATRVGEGLVIRVGLPEWSARLGDRQVAQITRNIADLVRGSEPKIRSAP